MTQAVATVPIFWPGDIPALDVYTRDTPLNIWHISEEARNSQSKVAEAEDASRDDEEGPEDDEDE